MKIITNYVELGIRVIKDSDNDCYYVEKDGTLIYEICNNGAGNSVEIICHKKCRSIIISCDIDDPCVKTEIITVSVDRSGLEGHVLININALWDNVVFMWA